MPEQQRNEPIPVTVIGGYLGAGKTTLINHLLHNANGMRLAILVNDFGDLAIDAALIESQDGDVISLSGGCVCCSYGNDLQAALMDTTAMPQPPDHIVIESSGVALPGAIGAALTLIRSMRLHGIVTLADASTLQQHATDKYLADTIERQLHDADIIVLNKSDLIDPELLAEVEVLAAGVNSSARIVSTSHAAIATMIVLDQQPQMHKTTLPHNADHTIHFQTLTLTAIKAVDAEQLAAALASETCGLLRAKGFVPHNSGQLKTIQIVGRRWNVTDAPSNVTCGLVCIGMADQWNVPNAIAGFDGVAISS